MNDRRTFEGIVVTACIVLAALVLAVALLTGAKG